MIKNKRLSARSMTLLVSFWLATLIASYILTPVMEEQFGVTPTIPKILQNYLNNPEAYNLPSYIFNQLFGEFKDQIITLLALLGISFTIATVMGSSNFAVYYLFPAALIYAVVNFLVFPVNSILFSTNIDPVVKLAVGGWFFTLIFLTITTFTSGRD